MNNFLGVPLLNLKLNNYNLIINSIITKTELEIPITGKRQNKLLTENADFWILL